MQTLLGAMRTGNRGEPLPPVFTQFEEYDLKIRTGELTMIAAAPGGCKTVLALTVALRTFQPTMYFSADTSVADISSRLVAMMRHEQHTVIQEHLTNGGRHHYDDDLRRGLRHIRWDFTPQLSLEHLEQEIDAFAQVFADYPHLIVIDCLKNMTLGGEDDFSKMRHAMDALSVLAKNTGSAVMVLHHLVGEYDNGRPPDLSSIQNKLTKEAALVLGLFTIDDDWVGQKLVVSVLKNRAGLASAGGTRRLYLPMNLSIMSLG